MYTTKAVSALTTDTIPFPPMKKQHFTVFIKMNVFPGNATTKIRPVRQVRVQQESAFSGELKGNINRDLWKCK